MLGNRDPFALRNLAAELMGTTTAAAKPSAQKLAAALKNEGDINPVISEAPGQRMQPISSAPVPSRSFIRPQTQRQNPENVGEAVGFLAQDASDIIMQKRQQEAEQERMKQVGEILQRSGADPTLIRLAQAMPEMRGELLAKALQGEEPETFKTQEVTGPDGKPMLAQIGSKGTVRPLEGYAPYEKPEKTDLPNSVQEYNYAVDNGFQGTYADWKSSNKPQTSVTFNDKGFDELAKLDAQAISDVGEGVRTLRTMLPDLDRMVTASEKFGTGATGNMKLWAGQFARSLGIEGVDNLEQGELVRAIQNRLAPQMRATGSGASSDRDVEMFLTSLPNLMQTPGGNKLIADNFRRILERKQDEERLMRRHYRDTGGTLDGVYQRIDEELGPSIFTDEDRALIVGAGQNGLPQYAPQQSAPGGTGQSPRLRYNPETDELEPVGPDASKGGKF